MTKVGEHITLDIIATTKEYDPSVFEKVIQTFLSIIDFIKLLFIKNLNYDNQLNHNILEQEINLNERI